MRREHTRARLCCTYCVHCMQRVRYISRYNTRGCRVARHLCRRSIIRGGRRSPETPPRTDTLAVCAASGHTHTLALVDDEEIVIWRLCPSPPPPPHMHTSLDVYNNNNIIYTLARHRLRSHSLSPSSLAHPHDRARFNKISREHRHLALLWRSSTTSSLYTASI